MPHIVITVDQQALDELEAMAVEAFPDVEPPVATVKLVQHSLELWALLRHHVKRGAQVIVHAPNEQPQTLRVLH